jgi:hypothetical protein
MQLDCIFYMLAGGCLATVIMALVSSELHCSSNFSRRFFWTSNWGL